MTLTLCSAKRSEANSKMLKVHFRCLETIKNVLALFQLHMASITGAECMR